MTEQVIPPSRIAAVVRLVSAVVRACSAVPDDDPPEGFVEAGVLREMALEAKAEAMSLSHEVDLLRGALLESAAEIDVLEKAPVVPEGWRVSKRSSETIGIKSPREDVWVLDHLNDGKQEPTACVERDGWLSALAGQDSIAPSAALLALLWAAEHDAEPPHEQPVSVEQPAPQGENERITELEAELGALSVERSNLRARIAALEAPPVVPRGWEVLRYDHGHTYEWRLCGNGATNAPRPAAAYRALAWAIEHDAVPLHEDVTVTEFPVVPAGWTVHRSYGTWTALGPAIGAPMTANVASALDWALRRNRRPPHEDAAVLEGQEYKSRRSSARVIVDLVMGGHVHIRVVDPSGGLIRASKVQVKDWERLVVYPHELELVAAPAQETP